MNIAVTNVVTYPLQGLHCGACVQRVKTALLPFDAAAQVTLEPMQVTLNTNSAIADLQAAVSQAGKYQILPPISLPTANISVRSRVESNPTQTNWLKTYFPLLMIVGFILASSLGVQIGMGSQITAHHTMQFFMAGFFLVFAFFKQIGRASCRERV